MMKNKLMKCYQDCQCFTLIEAMVVVAITTSLATIILPAYQTSVTKSRRSNAMIALNALQLAEEKYRANNSAYGTLTRAGGSGTSSGGYYAIITSSNTNSGPTLTATAETGTSQASDKARASRTLTQAGTMTTYGPSTAVWSQ